MDSIHVVMHCSSSLPSAKRQHCLEQYPAGEHSCLGCVVVCSQRVGSTFQCLDFYFSEREEMVKYYFMCNKIFFIIFSSILYNSYHMTRVSVFGSNTLIWFFVTNYKKFHTHSYQVPSIVGVFSKYSVNLKVALLPWVRIIYIYTRQCKTTF